MDEPTTFDELKAPKAQASCVRCGKDAKGTVSIRVEKLPRPPVYGLQRQAAQQSANQDRTVRTKSVRLCESCAVAVYLVLEKCLTEKAKPESSG